MPCLGCGASVCVSGRQFVQGSANVGAAEPICQLSSTFVLLLKRFGWRYLSLVCMDFAQIQLIDGPGMAGIRARGDTLCINLLSGSEGRTYVA